jgi:hypothetical protein
MMDDLVSNFGCMYVINAARWRRDMDMKQLKFVFRTSRLGAFDVDEWSITF